MRKGGFLAKKVELQRLCRIPQSPPDKHGNQVEATTRHVWDVVALRGKWEMGQLPYVSFSTRRVEISADIDSARAAGRACLTIKKAVPGSGDRREGRVSEPTGGRSGRRRRAEHVWRSRPRKRSRELKSSWCRWNVWRSLRICDSIDCSETMLPLLCMLGVGRVRRWVRPVSPPRRGKVGAVKRLMWEG